MPEAPPEVAVPEKLPPVPFEGVPGWAHPLDREIRGFHLFDQPMALGALDAPVETARQNGGPALEGDARLQVHLGAVAGEGLAACGENARVDFASETEAAPAVAAIEADSPETLVLGKLARRDIEDLGCLVEAQCSGPPYACEAEEQTDKESVEWQATRL